MKDDEVVPTAKLAFEIALMAIDAEMAQLQEIESGHDQSGSTSVMTLITKSHIVCANTGDSRAVLCRGGEQVPLSHDHKPFNPGEKERIENAGSHVKFNRVNGDLAVSRALGDFVYKRCETVEAEHQAVTAFPEVIAEVRHPRDEFIVLACDGIWDVMSSQEVCDKVREMLLTGPPPPPPPDETPGAEDGPSSGPPSEPPRPPPPPRPWDLGAVCECLIDHCLRLGSRDNMSVIIVMLNQQMMPKLEHGTAAGRPLTLQAASASVGGSGGGSSTASTVDEP
jgi:serine/threonine protein phosphatase PrpC